MKILPDGASSLPDGGIEMGMSDGRNTAKNDGASFHVNVPPFLERGFLLCLRCGSTCGGFQALREDIERPIRAFYVRPIAFSLQNLSGKSFPFREIYCTFQQGNVIEFYRGHNA